MVNNKDQLFLRFISCLLLLMILFGIAMTIVILTDDSGIGLRMVNAFASMFVGVLGLGSGYLLGRNEGPPVEKRKEDAND